MATRKISVGNASVNELYLGASRIRKAWRGASVVWDVTMFIDEPKIDPEHPLVTEVATMQRLTNGALEGMVTVTGTPTVVDDAFASSAAGTQVLVSEPLPATSPTSLRVSALIKVDKTSGRYSRVGFASNTATPGAFSPDIFVGHTAGSGIVVGSTAGAMNGVAYASIPEAKLVDGAWYRVSLTWTTTFNDPAGINNLAGNRVMGASEPVDPANTPTDPWYPPFASTRHPATYTPMALIARTNSPNGTIKDLRYVDTLLGYNADNAPVLIHAFDDTSGGSNTNDPVYGFSKAKAAPLRIIVAAGGTGIYGGVNDFAVGNGRAGHPHDAFRKFWRDLAELGYTVLHANALHEGWGADDHLQKQIDFVNMLQAESNNDARIYYLGYSLGGLSAWRAIMGRAGFPPIRAAYIIAGAAHLDDYYDQPMFTQIQTRWPDRQALDEPINFDPAQLVARGTRVRMVTSTGDTNIPKAYAHDPMVAKFASAPELISELVHSNIAHFDPTYWNALDCVNFFEGADL